jgi:hypothetical protein
MRFVMTPDMVYQYPIWAVGLLLVGASVLGAVLLELCARRLLCQSSFDKSTTTWQRPCSPSSA